MKLIKTVRTHWKKSLFFLGCSVMGANYGYNRYHEHLLLRQYCLQIQHHSLDKNSPELPIKQMIVFMNPSSGKGKAAKTFNKFALPMLNMSGINFTVVPTSYEGHVSSLLKYLPEHTAGVVVAGGDGMLQDTVTALLRSKKCAHMPVGFIPLGENNTFCRRYLDNPTTQSNVDLICQSVINIVQGNVQKMPIMELQPEKGKVIYALSYFTWGSVKEAIEWIPKFWWTGGLQTVCAMLRFSLKSAWPCNISTLLDGELHSLSNITILPGTESLVKHYCPAVQQRKEFLEDIGLAINSNKHLGFLAKLTLGQPPSEDTFKEMSIDPQSDGKFYVDGEEVDSRGLIVRFVSDKVSMFVPSEVIPPESVRVIPEVPRSVSNLIDSVYSSISGTVG